MDKAQTSVFLTAAFGVTDVFEEVSAEDKDYLRYLLLEKEDNHMQTLRRVSIIVLLSATFSGNPRWRIGCARSFKPNASRG